MQGGNNSWKTWQSDDDIPQRKILIQHMSTRLRPTPRAAKTKRLRAPRCPPRFDFSRSLPSASELAYCTSDPVPLRLSLSLRLFQQRKPSETKEQQKLLDFVLRSEEAVYCGARTKVRASIHSSPMKRPTFALKIHPAKLETKGGFDRIPPSTDATGGLRVRPVRSREPTRRHRRDDTLAISVPRSDRDSVASSAIAREISWRGRFWLEIQPGGSGRSTNRFCFFPPRYPTQHPRSSRVLTTCRHDSRIQLAQEEYCNEQTVEATAGGGAHQGGETQDRRPGRPGRHSGRPSRSQMQQMLGTSGGRAGCSISSKRAAARWGNPRWSQPMMMGNGGGSGNMMMANAPPGASARQGDRATFMGGGMGNQQQQVIRADDDAAAAADADAAASLRIRSPGGSRSLGHAAEEARRADEEAATAADDEDAAAADAGGRRSRAGDHQGTRRGSSRSLRAAPRPEDEPSNLTPRAAEGVMQRQAQQQAAARAQQGGQMQGQGGKPMTEDRPRRRTRSRRRGGEPPPFLRHGPSARRRRASASTLPTATSQPPREHVPEVQVEFPVPAPESPALRELLEAPPESEGCPLPRVCPVRSAMLKQRSQMLRAAAADGGP